MNAAQGLIIGFVALLLIGGIFLFSGEATNNTTVRVGYLPILGDLPVFVAQEKGFFEKNSVQVELIRFESSNLAVEALVRGDIDVLGEGSIVPVLIAEQIDPGNIKLISYLDIVSETPFDQLIVKSDSSILNLNGLAGKKIGVFPGSTSAALLRHFLEQKGVDVSTITFVQLPPSNQLPTLESGSIDALLSFEPTTTIALESGSYTSIYGSVFASLLNHSPQGAGMMSTAFIQKNPILAQQTVHAFDDAIEYMQTNEQDVRETVIPKYFKLSPQVSQKVQITHSISSDEMDPSIVQAFANLLTELGELPHAVNVNGLLFLQ
ncbi:MAG: ABC transporter substrate-binding protein [archaeon]